MIFGSVCSGIEAASVAWHPLGWKASWLAEIEPFPAAVLAHHYPEVPNLGDMTKIAKKVLTGEVEAPDVLVGGTPCQAFSVAGLREGLADERGQLTIKYVELADAIDFIRGRRGQQPSIIVWENVPGVLSSKDNAFGCFLGALAGEDDELQPPREKWANAGCVFGPERTVAWRVLDAQYFGVAQRRRRVFLVASARKDFDPTAVLFEFDGMRRDTAPSRGAGQEAAAGTLRSTQGGSDVDHARAGHLQPVMCMAHGQGGAEIATERSPTLTCNHEVPIAAYAIQAGALRTNPASDPDGVGVQEGHAYTLEAQSEVQAVAFQPGNVSRGAGAAPSHDVFPTLKADHGRAFSDQSPHVAVAGPMTACGGTEKKHGFGWGQQDWESGYCQPTQDMQVRRLTPVECERLQGFPDGWTNIPWRNKHASECPDGPRYKALGNSMAVPCMAWIGRRIQDAIA